MKRKLRVCSLFSGMGGFETGVYNALGEENVEVVFASEIDKKTQESYQIIYGELPKGDITQVDEREVPDHDLLVAGFPCQAFSMSGRRLGFSDTRGTLFFEIARIAKEKKPKMMLLENVKGLISHDKGKTFEIILEVLSELGYAVDFKLLNSKGFHVPQHRERIYIVCSRKAVREEWKVGGVDALSKLKKRLNETNKVKSFNFSFPLENAVTPMLQSVLEEEVEESYFLEEKKEAKILARIQEKGYQKAVYRTEQNQETGNAIHKEPLLSVCSSVEGKRELLIGKEAQLRFVTGASDKTNWVKDGKDISRNYKQGSRIYDTQGIASTLTARGVGSEGGHTGLYLTDTWRIRRLTALETMRLQGFPDAYYTKLVEKGVSQRQIYKMTGNAVTTNVIAGIVSSMKEQHYL